jgi:RimJ/RimL family protein N-acetyltransferase
MPNTKSTYTGNLTADTVYESEHFLLRLVRESDAVDLLECYSDPAAQKLFNYDPSTNTTYYEGCNEKLILDMIRSWLKEFERKSYIRFAVVDKCSGKAVGTVEIYDKLARENKRKYAGWGVVRIDIISIYETADHIGELLSLFERENFYELFNVDLFVTKAVPEATERIQALQTAGYSKFNWDAAAREHYWAKHKNQNPG